MKMLVMIRGVTTINNDIADCERASTGAQNRQALDTDIGALQTAEQVVAHVSGDDLTALKTAGQGQGDIPESLLDDFSGSERLSLMGSDTGYITDSS
jgi:hypothetical protein